MKKVKILFYDIETKPLSAYIWRLGKQVVNYRQLMKTNRRYGIICIAYAWNDGKPTKVIDWGYDEQDSGKVIEEFDKIIKQADITIGKNSDSFDTKHINTQRLLHGLPPLPDWINHTEDVEKQLRKHFIFPSYGLDYVAEELGLGGKDKMEMQDWIDIVEKTSEKSFRKMSKYCKNDVEKTRTMWNRIRPYVKPKFNMATFYGDFRCANCGSKNIRKDGVRTTSKTTYQQFYCRDHRGYAGRAPVRANGNVGLIGL